MEEIIKKKRGRPKKIQINEEKLTMLKNSNNPNQMEIEETKKIEEIKLNESVIAELNGSSLTLKEIEQPKETVILPLLKTNIPPIIRSRNEYGFLENVDYVFKENGKVDWRKMIPAEYLIFNEQKKSEIEKTYGKKIEELSVTEVDDKYLMILLFGIRYLASLRGFYAVTPHVDFSTDYKAVVTTIIDWIPNNDTEMREESFGDVASTSPSNTNGFGQMFLESMATNRSFVRAVRNYLEINIVGKDEVKPESKEDRKNEIVQSDPTSIHTILQKTAEDLGLTFDNFKEGVKLKYINQIESDYTKWMNFKDLPPSDAYKLVGILKKAKATTK